jgi:hypothetical protein
MNFEDVTGRTIDIGDIILYTMSTDGSAARMECGEVTKFNPKSIVVQPLNPTTFDPVMRERIDVRKTGKVTVYYAGTPNEWKHEEVEYINTGDYEPVGTQLIPKPMPYRFFILRKI